VRLRPAQSRVGSLLEAGTNVLVGYPTDARARHDQPPRSCGARRLLPGIRPLGRGGAEAEGDADAPEAALRHHPAEPMALAVANKQLELMSKFMSELGLSPVARTRVEVKPLGPKPWETTSKFAGLLGGRGDRSDDRNDEYFGWAGR
jgi:hypothetical protein